MLVGTSLQMVLGSGVLHVAAAEPRAAGWMPVCDAHRCTEQPDSDHHQCCSSTACRDALLNGGGGAGRDCGGGGAGARPWTAWVGQGGAGAQLGLTAFSKSEGAPQGDLPQRKRPHIARRDAARRTCSSRDARVDKRQGHLRVVVGEARIAGGHEEAHTERVALAEGAAAIDGGGSRAGIEVGLAQEVGPVG